MKIFILALILGALSPVHAQDKYYGGKSTEAILRFEGKILLAPGLTTTQKREAIDGQVQHLIGHFQAPTFLASYKYPGVLGQNYKVILTREAALAGAVEVRYRFEGKVNYHRNVFRSSDKTTVPLNLPLDPEAIYDLGVVRGKNRCTDDHYNAAGDFFYFWDPDKEGCPLKGNKTDVLRIKGTLEKLANTTTTYPEYDRLYGKETLKASIFIGYINNTSNRDIGAGTYRSLRESLPQLGLKLKEEKKQFKTASNGRESTGGVNNRARFEGEVQTQLGQTVKLELTLLLSETEPDNIDATFHQHLVSAYQYADLVAYDGHSGLGGNLDLNNLPVFSFNRNYQIFFFNGCSSYPYFNQNYFNSKPGGSRNLEIITAGLPTLTSTSESNMLAFLTPFLSGHLTSWQNIMNRIEASNGEEDTYLMGVNGDEDNQFLPR